VLHKSGGLYIRYLMIAADPRRWLQADPGVVETPVAGCCRADVAGTVLNLVDRRQATSGIDSEQISDAGWQYPAVAYQTLRQISQQRFERTVTLVRYDVDHAAEVSITVAVQAHLQSND
jgi:hypothetical protein